MKLFTLCLLLSINAIADISSFTLSSEKTLYIVDGDSVSMQMRIKGIDTPEIKQTQFDKDGLIPAIAQDFK
ncbi:MAG: hypothetical protein DSZ17_02110, partial [Candidatus Thioglobus sp.]